MLICLGFAKKSNFQGGSQKNNIQQEMPKKGGLDSLQIYGGGHSKKEWGGVVKGVDTPMLTMKFHMVIENAMLIIKNKYK